MCLFLLQGSFTCEASHGGVGVVGFRFRIEGTPSPKPVHDLPCRSTGYRFEKKKCTTLDPYSSEQGSWVAIPVLSTVLVAAFRMLRVSCST